MISFTRVFKFVTKPKNVRFINTVLNKKLENSDRVWSQFVMKNKKDGRLVQLRVQNVPKDRFEDVIDLKMNHFVKDEITYKVSGISTNPKAVQECREVLSDMMRQPLCHTHVYFIDDESGSKSELVGASSLLLISKDEPEEETKVKTKEMQKFFDIVDAWNQLYPYEEVFKHYGINCFYQDGGLVIHPKYRLLGVAKYEALVRRLVCLTHGVDVTGSWCTMEGSQRAAAADGWETLFDMSYTDLGPLLGIDFKDASPTCKYMAVKVL